MKILLAYLVLISFSNCEKLRVHIIPHSHQDPGWLTTIEGYYTGKSSPFGECVKCVIERVFRELQENTNMVFTWAELAFLLIWQKTATVEEKAQFRQFLATKQIDFVNGGYVTNDEACSHYEDVIEQLTYGNRFLKEEYGFMPTTAWHIDPFGHSGTVASIFAQAGFDSFFIERSNEEEMHERAQNGALEFIWNPSGSGNYILTHYNYLKYGGLDQTGYCLPSLCNNWQQDMNKLAEWFINQRKGYPYDILLLHIGKDFSFGFSDDQNLFKEIEAFVSKFNGYKYDDHEFEVFLSTPSNYTKDFFEEYARNPAKKLDVKESDNFPYIEDLNYAKRYWTGYFTSRPQIKLIMRQSGNLLQTYRKFFSSVFISNDFNETRNFSYYDVSIALDKLEQAVSLAQHHDGISGTAKSWVERDYVNKLFDARMGLDKYVDNYFKEKQDLDDVDFINCPQNISFLECNISRLEKGNTLILNIFNPGNNGKRLVKAKVPHANIKLSSQHSQIKSDIFCFNSIYKSIDCEIVFEDYFIMAETRTYLLEYDESDNSVEKENKDKPERIPISETSWIEIKKLDPIKLEHKYCEERNCIQEEFSMDYYFYRSNQDSAYILWTDFKNPEDLTEFESYDVHAGKNFLYLVFHDNGKHVQARLSFNRNDPKAIKLFTEVAPIDLAINAPGVEIILKLSSNIKSEGKFKTDSNSLLINKRERQEESGVSRVARNYYPVNSQISIEDSVRKLVLMNDRSQGGTSLYDGELELMIHRRVMSTGQGIGEYLDDKEPNSDDVLKVSTEHTIMIFDPESGEECVRGVQYENENPLFIMYGVDNTKKEMVKTLQQPKSHNSLPSNLKFSLRPYSKHEFIVRFVNLNEKKSVTYEFNKLMFGQKVNTIISSLSCGMKAIVKECEEVSINTIHRKKDIERRRFREIEPQSQDPRSLSIDSLFFKPLEIRTFHVKVSIKEPSSYENDDFRLRFLYGN